MNQKEFYISFSLALFGMVFAVMAFYVDALAWLLGLLGGLLILGFIVHLVRVNQKLRRCTENITAKILKVKEEWYGETSETGDQYNVFVTVEYEVNGKKYKANLVLAESQYLNANAISPIKEGEEVVLRYNPQKPEEIIFPTQS